MYSNICSTDVAKIKGTGRPDEVCIAGRIEHWYWMPADSYFDTVTAAADIDTINAKVAAGELYYLGSPAEEEANDTEAEYNETTYGNVKYRTKKAKKGIKIQLQESACTIDALKSFDGRNGRLMGLSLNGVWVGVHEKDTGRVKGQLTSQFDVDYVSRAIADGTELLPITITFSDPDEYDRNRYQAKVDWTAGDIDQVFDAEITISDEANAGSELTFTMAVAKDCVGTALAGLLTAHVEFKTDAGAVLTATVTGASSPYTVSVSTALTSGTIGIKDIVTISGVNYSSDLATVAVSA